MVGKRTGFGKAFAMLCDWGMDKPYDLKKRTMAFALRISDFCETLPNHYRGWHVQKQLFRAGTGAAANYRAACRGKSKPDFIAKLAIAIEETDETDFWLEFAVESKLVRAASVMSLRKEADELLAIFSRSKQTAEESMRAQQRKIQ